MEKNIVQVGLEFVFGPILKDDQLPDGSFSSGSKLVDNDEIINKLDKEINDLWVSLYKNDENSPSGMSFDSAKEKIIAPTLLALLNKLLKRLNEINDGSFEVVDTITDYFKKIIK